MYLWLPDDWQTAGKAGQRQCAARGAEAKPGEEPAVIDFRIGHGKGEHAGYIRFDFAENAIHRNFDVELRPGKDPKTGWTWSFRMWFGGNVDSGVSQSGRATIEPYQPPTTQPR